MVTDVIAIEEMDGLISYRRPINAGSMFAMVRVEGDRRVLTVRATASKPLRRTQRPVRSNASTLTPLRFPTVYNSSPAKSASPTDPT